MIYADQRWLGQHGIGRFSRYVLGELDYRPVALKSRPAAAFDSWFLARALRHLAPTDLFFSPGYNSPLFCRAPFVFTIHDLSHVYCPENSSPAIRLYYATIMKRACHRAMRILTVSEFTKRQIVEWSGVAPEKISNVWSGVDPEYQPKGNSYGIPFPYLLCVSNRKPHKNELRIVEAFARAKLDSQIHLVFVGVSTDKLRYCIENNSVAQRVNFVGFVPPEKLPSLYRGATALIFPSLYEGFGLPPLEAMACGIPVVTSNVTSMPEITGDAALHVDPTSVEQIARAMERIVGDVELRRQLLPKGLARSAEFTCSRTAALVREVIAECLVEIRGNNAVPVAESE